MSNITLGPSVQTPEWALNIPESKWIEDLLIEVRKQKFSQISDNSKK